jgi:hypothetical protein
LERHLSPPLQMGSPLYVYIMRFPKKKKKKPLLRTPNIHELLEMVGWGKNDYEEGKIYLLKKEKEKVI